MPPSRLSRQFIMHKSTRLLSAHRLMQNINQLRRLNMDANVRALWIQHEQCTLLIVETEPHKQDIYLDMCRTEGALNDAVSLDCYDIRDAALDTPLACLELSSHRVEPGLAHVYAVAQSAPQRAPATARCFLSMCLQINHYRAAA